MKVYVASSWRNTYQPGVVKVLADRGHDVYDFRNPRPGDHGFHWSQIDPDWQLWKPGQYRRALSNPIAEAGYASDKAALDWCDCCVLVLPSGRSAHSEAAYVAGKGLPVCVYIPEPTEPELMYKLFDFIAIGIVEVLDWITHLHEVQYGRNHVTHGYHVLAGGGEAAPGAGAVAGLADGDGPAAG